MGAIRCPCSKPDCGGGGHVYFVGTTWHIKIGYSANPAKRLRALRAGCPLVLATMSLMPGTPDDEKALHRRFAHLRIQHEWFRSKVLSAGEIEQFLESTWMARWAWDDNLGFGQEVG